MTATVTKESILDAVASMSVMEVVELVKAMEEKFGVSATAMVAAAPVAGAAAGGAQAAEEKTEFNIILKSAGDKKIEVIKVVRQITGLGLKEAKDMVEGAPSTVKEGVNKEESQKIKKALEEAGAQVEIK